ncbi:MAG: DNA replication/repair protein RecF [Thermoleophilia bacterium]
MYLKRMDIRGFRNYREGSVRLGPGVSIVVGKNGTGKTSLLEAAQYSICGRSFRTSRDAEMVREGSGFFRLATALETGGVERNRLVSLEAGSPARVDQGGGPRWEQPGSVLCFSPDDLQLVKGPPAERRRFLDDAISRRHPAYQQLVRDYQKVLAQRNRFLQRARAGLVRLSDISPWDRQLMSLALLIHEARADYCRSLTPGFDAAYGSISGGEENAAITYISQLDRFIGSDDPDAQATRELEQQWSSDLERGTTNTGTHRDDVDFLVGGKSMRVFGSQGEQRSAVLSLLLADARMDCPEGSHPLLLFDDVLSELDPDRRRRLLAALGNGLGSQVIITAADPSLIPESALAEADVMEIGPDGRVRARETQGG